MSSPAASTALLAIALMACFCSGAMAHGFLKTPVSRNYRAHLDGQEYDHMSLGSRDPNMPICGRSKYNTPRPVTDTFTQGDVIDVEVTITAPHLGRFELRVCDQASPTMQCFEAHNLVRADPVHPGGKYWYYESAGDGSNWGDQAYGRGTFGLKFKLPEDVTCEHCTLQWFWWTGNDCAPTPCELDPRYMGPDASCGADYSHGNTCSSPWSASGSEFFINCADVAILPRDGPVPSPIPPSPSPSSPSVNPSPPPTVPSPAPVNPSPPPIAPSPSPIIPSPSPIVPSPTPIIPSPQPSPIDPSPAPSPSPASCNAIISTMCAGKHGDHLANPCTCAGFVQCVHGTAVVKDCAAGLLWDDAAQVCNWPSAVQCNL